MTAANATVIVSRRIRASQQRRFRRWLRRLRKACERAPGYVGMTVHPPGTTHPYEWVVVYQFASDHDLDRWLRCSERAALIEESDEFLADRPIEQRVVQPRNDSVTLISAVRLRPGSEDHHRYLHQQAVDAASEVGGLVRHELLPAVPGAQPETVALLTFDTRQNLNRWMSSPLRRQVLNEMSRLSASERSVNVVGGYAGWFHPHTNKQPKRWKQALAVLAGLIPVSLVVTALRVTLAPQLPLLVSVTLTATANVAMLTWIVMPLITRALDPWLSK
jgi:uncharacterized protein